jgi:hypothetical protein
VASDATHDGAFDASLRLSGDGAQERTCQNNSSEQRLHDGSPNEGAVITEGRELVPGNEAVTFGYPRALVLNSGSKTFGYPRHVC